MFILLVEDDHELGCWLCKALQQAGHHADWCGDGRAAEASLMQEDYDCLILDLGLPGKDGHTLLKQLRSQDKRLPVLILTARDSLAERVNTLNEGADDFLAKPFALEELEARLAALVRRARGIEHPRLACGGLRFDHQTRQFMVDHHPLSLSPREHELLYALIQRSGEPLSKKQILNRVFNDEEDVPLEAIEVLIHRVRKRLEGTGIAIHTYRGLGYALELLREKP